MRDLIYTLFVFLLVVALVFVAAGWVKYDRSPGKSTLEVKTGEVERVAEQAEAKSRELFDQAKRGVEQMVDGSVTKEPPPARVPVSANP